MIVEPRAADCLYQSALAGAAADASGDLMTSRGMLSCGRPSQMAWTILRTAADFFMVIDDSVAASGFHKPTRTNRMDDGIGSPALTAAAS